MQFDQEWELYTAEELLLQGIKFFGNRITFASSFGAEDVVIIDMLAKIAPRLDIFFLDTDLHFPETYQTIERLQNYYNRTFTQVKASLSLEEQQEKYQPELWKEDPDLCCSIRKVEPLTKYLSKFDAWITGIRREQSPTRAHAKKFESDERFGLKKLNPLVDWTHDDIWDYIETHQVPYNPLHKQGYPSIGCTVCTKPVQVGEDIRSGRWSGFVKTECGLHK